mmetsp:Transcript_33212/g.75071  ORF Transcript_33212/g.75071 Transcript_33212/m.75071 type:complete len:341 (-) Transcript_33212:387-1409(-)
MPGRGRTMQRCVCILIGDKQTHTQGDERIDEVSASLGTCGAEQRPGATRIDHECMRARQVHELVPSIRRSIHRHPSTSYDCLLPIPSVLQSEHALPFDDLIAREKRRNLHRKVRITQRHKRRRPWWREILLHHPARELYFPVGACRQALTEQRDRHRMLILAGAHCCRLHRAVPRLGLLQFLKHRVPRFEHLGRCRLEISWRVEPRPATRLRAAFQTMQGLERGLLHLTLHKSTLDHVDHIEVCAPHLGNNLLDRQRVQVDTQSRFDHEHRTLHACSKHLDPRERRKDALLLVWVLRYPIELSPTIDHPHLHLEDQSWPASVARCVLHCHGALKRCAHER